jgi:hypothetical protein
MNQAEVNNPATTSRWQRFGVAVLVVLVALIIKFGLDALLNN